MVCHSQHAYFFSPVKVGLRLAAHCCMGAFQNIAAIT